MAKIIRLESKQHTVVNYLKKLIEMAERGEISNILVASFYKGNKIENEVMTGYFELDVIERQILVSTLQTDISYAIVESNIDNLIEKL